MAGKDREPAWVRSDRQILVREDLDRLATGGVRALARDHEPVRHGCECLVELPNLLVHRSEERLVAGSADLPFLLYLHGAPLVSCNCTRGCPLGHPPEYKLAVH